MGEEGDAAHLSGLKADGFEGSKRQVVPVGELSESTDNTAKQRKYSQDTLQLQSGLLMNIFKLSLFTDVSEDETKNLHMKLVSRYYSQHFSFCPHFSFKWQLMAQTFVLTADSLTLLHWAPSRGHRVRRKPAQSNSRKTSRLLLLVFLREDGGNKTRRIVI